jgi:aldehyde dehydrogenase (NAD+)
LKVEYECGYALGASVFTRTPEKAVQLAARLRNGSVVVNDVVVSTAHPATPFGGRGESGWGVTQGAEGLLEMTVPQVVSIRRGSSRPHYVPVGDPGALPGDILRGMLKLSHGSSPGQRLGGVRQLLRGWWNWR